MKDRIREWPRHVGKNRHLDPKFLQKRRGRKGRGGRIFSSSNGKRSRNLSPDRCRGAASPPLWGKGKKKKKCDDHSTGQKEGVKGLIGLRIG